MDSTTIKLLRKKKEEDVGSSGENSNPDDNACRGAWCIQNTEAYVVRAGRASDWNLLGQEGARIGFSLENNKSSRVLSLGLH
jgi:hypothetical protein